MSQQINLLGTTKRKRAFSFTSTAAMVYASGIAVALCAVLGIYENYRLREVEAQAVASEAKLKEIRIPYQQLVAELSKRKPDPTLDAKIAELNAELKTRQEIMDALKGGVIGSVEGFSEYMRAFSRQMITGLWLTGFDIAAGGQELTITGRALNAELVPNYVQRLTRERSLQGRQFASMRIAQPSAARPVVLAKDGKPQPALPPFLEFMMSSADIGADGKPQVTDTARLTASEKRPLETAQVIKPAEPSEPAAAPAPPTAAAVTPPASAPPPIASPK